MKPYLKNIIILGLFAFSFALAMEDQRPNKMALNFIMNQPSVPSARAPFIVEKWGSYATEELLISLMRQQLETHKRIFAHFKNS